MQIQDGVNSQRNCLLLNEGCSGERWCSPGCSILRWIGVSDSLYGTRRSRHQNGITTSSEEVELAGYAKWSVLGDWSPDDLISSEEAKSFELTSATLPMRAGNIHHLDQIDSFSCCVEPGEGMEGGSKRSTRVHPTQARSIIDIAAAGLSNSFGALPRLLGAEHTFQSKGSARKHF